MTHPLAIQSAFAALHEALARAGVPYAFIGAMPVLVWGRVRTTTDLDVVVLVTEAEWPAVERAIEAAGFKSGPPLVPGGAGEALPDIAQFWSSNGGAVAVDLFIAKTEFEREVLATCVRASLLGMEVPLARPEASIIYKLISYRPHDQSDVEAIFVGRSKAGVELDWSFLDKWSAEWGVTERLAPFRARFDPTSPA